MLIQNEQKNQKNDEIIQKNHPIETHEKNEFEKQQKNLCENNGIKLNHEINGKKNPEQI
jgi:hypothetical protein